MKKNAGGKISQVRIKYLRISSQKLNGMARQVRGLSVIRAQEKLKFVPQKAARLLLKALRAAVSSALAKQLNESRLLVKRLEVGQGPSLKRGIPVSRGVYHPIIKKTSHVLVELEEAGNGAES